MSCGLSGQLSRCLKVKARVPDLEQEHVTFLCSAAAKAPRCPKEGQGPGTLRKDLGWERAKNRVHRRVHVPGLLLGKRGYQKLKHTEQLASITCTSQPRNAQLAACPSTTNICGHLVCARPRTGPEGPGVYPGFVQSLERPKETDHRKTHEGPLPPRLPVAPGPWPGLRLQPSSCLVPRGATCVV